jgi:hypothetical protein
MFGTSSVLSRGLASLSWTDAEKQLAELLFDDNLQVISSLELNQMASYTYHERSMAGSKDLCEKILDMLEAVLSKPLEHSTLTLHKTLVVLEHVLLYGAAKVLTATVYLASYVEPLLRYNTAIIAQQQGSVTGLILRFKGGTVDQGGPVRTVAQHVHNLLTNRSQLEYERSVKADPNSLVPVGRADQAGFYTDEARLQALQRRMEREKQIRLQSNLAKSASAFGSGYTGRDGKSVVGAAHSLDEMIKQAQKEKQKFTDEGGYQPPGSQAQATTGADQANLEDLLSLDNEVVSVSQPTAPNTQSVDLLDFGGTDSGCGVGGIIQYGTTNYDGDLLGTAATGGWNADPAPANDVFGGMAVTSTSDPFAFAATPTTGIPSYNPAVASGVTSYLQPPVHNLTPALSNNTMALPVVPSSAATPSTTTIPQTQPDRFAALDALVPNPQQSLPVGTPNGRVPVHLPHNTLQGKPPIEALEIRELSVILSYLTEKEGVRLLLTQRVYAKLLPIFQSKEDATWNNLSVQSSSIPMAASSLRKKRYEFKVVSIQNAAVLLAQLNTKRLHRRRTRPTPGMSTTELADTEWKTLSQRSVQTWYPPRLELLRFATQAPPSQTKTTVLVSYPRSGNTLARTLWERLTGTVTGSDTRPDRRLSLELSQRHDLVGEGITQRSRTSMVKTHWPERVGNCPFTAHRAILVVRNPYDAIDSYWNMNATCSHTKTLADTVYDQYGSKFAALVQNEIGVWLDFHHYWMQVVEVPVLIVRYEDLLQNTAHELHRMWQFVNGASSSADDPFIQKRIQHVLNDSSDQWGSYAPRSPMGQAAGKALRKGHIQQRAVQYIQNVAANKHATNYLQEFGYNLLSPTNNTVVTPAPCVSPVQRQGIVRINATAEHELRPRDCPFGRGLTKWRHSVTNNDSNPLPTINDSSNDKGKRAPTSGLSHASPSSMNSSAYPPTLGVQVHKRPAMNPSPNIDRLTDLSGLSLTGLSLSSPPPIIASTNTDSIKVSQLGNKAVGDGSMEAGNDEDNGFVMGGNVGTGLQPLGPAPAAPPPPPPQPTRGGWW